MSPEAATFLARHLLFLAGLTAASWAAGIGLARRLPATTPLERHAVAATLGLALLGHLAFLLGLLGWFAPIPLLIATALLSFFFWVRRGTQVLEPGGSPPQGSSEQALVIPIASDTDPARSEPAVKINRLLRQATSRVAEPISRAPQAQAGASDPEGKKAPAGSRRRRAAGLLAPALIIALALPFFFLALYPPTAFDATTYHLPTAAAFAATGRLPFLPTLRAPVFPPLSELLSAVALLLAGDVATHFVQLLAAALTAALLVAWGRSAGRPAAGLVAAALFLGNPIVAHLAATAYVEMLLTLFAAAALFAAERWRSTGHAGWIAAAGFLAASAAAVKYLGLLFVAWVGLLALADAWRRRRARVAALCAAVALAALLPAYTRIVAHTGNPVFPYLPGLFGHSAWSAGPVPPEHVSPALGEGPADVARRWARLPLLPWDLVFERERTNRQPPFSPFYLLALPVLAVGVTRDRQVRRLLNPAAAYLLLFPLLPPDARYLVPVLPPVSLATTLALQPLLDRVAAARRTMLVALLAAVCLLPGWLYAGWRVARQWPPPLTTAARERFLERTLPAYPAVRVLNRRHGGSYAVFALHAENLTYFAKGRFMGDWTGPAAYDRVLPHLADPAAVHARLRALGADHLLLVRGKDYGLGDDPEFRRRFLEVYSDRHARLFRLARR